MGNSFQFLTTYGFLNKNSKFYLKDRNKTYTLWAQIRYQFISSMSFSDSIFPMAVID